MSFLHGASKVINQWYCIVLTIFRKRVELHEKLSKSFYGKQKQYENVLKQFGKRRAANPNDSLKLLDYIQMILHI